MPIQYIPPTPYYTQMNYQPQQIPQMQPTQMPVAQQTPTIQGRMVTSREEALGIPVDFSGAPMFFPDLAHGVIYYKQFNSGTGSSEFREFKIAEQPAPTATPSYATTETVEAIKAEINTLKDEIATIRKPASKKGTTQDE